MVMILLYNSQCAVLKYRFWCSFVFFLDCRLNFDVMKLKHSKKHYYENILLLNTELSYIGIIYFIFFISLGHLYFTVPIFLFTFRCLWWCNLPSFCLTHYKGWEFTYERLSWVVDGINCNISKEKKIHQSLFLAARFKWCLNPVWHDSQMLLNYLSKPSSSSSWAA